MAGKVHPAPEDNIGHPSSTKAQGRDQALYKRAWDEQVAPRYRSGEPAPGTSRERFERMLAAAEYLANHIHEAPAPLLAKRRNAGCAINLDEVDSQRTRRNRRDDAIGAFRVPAISRPLKTETASSGPSRAESPAGPMVGGLSAGGRWIRTSGSACDASAA